MSITKIIRPQNNLTIIILAAGMGKRMKKGPKSLLEIDREPLILRQIRILRTIYPLADFIVVLGFGANEVYKILPKNVRIIENELFETTNVSHSLFLGLKASITDDVLIVYGDLVFTKKTLMSLTNNSSLLLNKEGKSDCIGVNISDGLICHLCYTSQTKWGQILYLAEPELKILKRVLFGASKKIFGCEVLNLAIEAGGKFVGIFTQGPLIELDTLSDIVKMKLLTEKL